MIVYLDEQQILDFVGNSSETLIHGFGYEWENENVVHLKTEPLLHSFGIARKVLFVKEENFHHNYLEEGYCYVVIVSSTDNVKVFKNEISQLIEIDFCFIPSQSELYSRNRGLIEIDILKTKRVLIVGLGSFGANIAVELAQAGVGNFALFDFDRLELHNLSRHYCLIKDLGRLKTDAIYDAIKGKNPYANIDKFPLDICDNISILNSEIEKADLVICATDNNASRYILSEGLVSYKTTGIFGRALTRAEGGDVFRYRPGGPCYCCIVDGINPSSEEITNVRSARRNGQIPEYVSASDAEAMVQVGLATDIEPITNLMVKLSLIELSRGMESGITKLENELVYDFYIWANRREKHFADWGPYVRNIEKKPTIMRWYGVDIFKNPNCLLCSIN